MCECACECARCRAGNHWSRLSLSVCEGDSLIMQTGCCGVQHSAPQPSPRWLPQSLRPVSGKWRLKGWRKLGPRKGSRENAVAVPLPKEEACPLGLPGAYLDSQQMGPNHGQHTQAWQPRRLQRDMPRPRPRGWPLRPVHALPGRRAGCRALTMRPGAWRGRLAAAMRRGENMAL